VKSAIATQPIVTHEGRISARFAALKVSGKTAFISYITAGDPDLATSAKIMAGLPKAGVDIIEISVPFTDPMADGPTIQQANLRALNGGISLKKVLQMVRDFRANDNETPIVLMGYYNPIYVYGVETFLKDAKSSGVDGLIVVDLPPEEDTELCEPARKVGINFIRLITPTTDAKRLPAVLKSASGFLYYVSIAGITGTRTAAKEPVKQAIDNLRRSTALPIAIGFGITTPDQAQQFAGLADGVIVGSAIVNRIADNLNEKNQAKPGLVDDVLSFVGDLAKAAHSA
jgi:tryptophan synthase alpha chain